MIGFYDIYELEMLAYEEDHPGIEIDKNRNKEMFQFCKALDFFCIESQMVDRTFYIEKDKIVISVVLICPFYEARNEKIKNIFLGVNRIKLRVVEGDDEGRTVGWMKFTFELNPVWK